MNTTQDTPHEHRFQPAAFDAHELEIIIGALNRYGVSNPTVANPKNLRLFTWDQVQQALLMSRSHCNGDSRDDVDDVIYNLRAERKSYVH
jgi:hypothetical protein